MNTYAEYADQTKQNLNASIQRVLHTANGRALIETAPDNNARSSGIEKGDGILVDTGERKPSTGGGLYLMQFSDGFKSLRNVMCIGNNDYSILTDIDSYVSTLDGIKIIGKVIGVLAVRGI